MQDANGIKSVVAIGSCKGGVGKTTVAVNIAMALRRTGYNVGLFDADLYGPNVPLMLGEVPLDPRYAKPVDAYYPFTQVDVRTPATEPFLAIAENIRTSLEK